VGGDTNRRTGKTTGGAPTRGSSMNNCSETRTLDGGQIASAPGPTARALPRGSATKGGKPKAARWAPAEAAVGMVVRRRALRTGERAGTEVPHGGS
jgi:hypothetical protein